MEEARLAAATLFGRDIAVDASAGTGKTATLIARVTNLFLLDKVLSPDDVLLLTFTEKAAGEMKSRITEGWELLLAVCRAGGGVADVQDRIAAWNPLIRIPGERGHPGEGYSPESLRLRASEMVDGVARLWVTTFHSFCARILRSFPAEAGVDPLFEVLTEGAAAEAWSTGFGNFLRGEFSRPEVDPRWEHALSRAPGQGAIFSMIRRLALYQRDLLLEGRLSFGSEADLLAYLREEYEGPVAWFREFIAGIADPGHEMVPVFRDALRLLDRGWEAVRAGNLDEARALAADGAAAFGFRADRTRSRKTFPQPPGMTLAGVRDALLAFWTGLRELPEGDRAARFLVDRARAALGLYEEAKGSALDFMDLLLRADALLRGNRDAAARLSRRFRHIFVDEFQDTDPLQADVLRALAAGAPPGKLFLVGDPKQSIYAFRRADIQVYNRFREDLVASGGMEVALARNFRSRPDLLAAINGLFAGVLPGTEDFSPPYAPVLPSRQDPGPGAAVTLYVLGEEVEEPLFLCGLVPRIAGLVPVGGRGGAPDRPAALGDVAVLYRSDTGVLAAYREAFAEAGIRHVVPSRRGFFARQEVQDLRMALSAVDEPADPAARYAALKSIFFGLSDDEILALHAPEGEPAPRVRDALGVLARLSARRGRASLTGLMADLFEETGVIFVAARLPEGERIVQNLFKAREMARAFEWKDGGSLKGFIAELRRRTDEDREETEFPAFDEGEDAVRVSTIHSSKGLEFPVVVLANLSRGGRKPVEGLRVDRVRDIAAVIFPGIRTYSAFRRLPQGGRTVRFEQWEAEKQAAEEKRLLYVAATRARDRLFLVTGKKGKGSEVQDALLEGLAGARDGGESRCAVTGLPGQRLLFPGGGEILRVAVEAPLPVPRRSRPGPPESAAPAGEEGVPPPGALPALPEPVSLQTFHDETRGKLFGAKIHRILEAYPPVTDPWPPPGTAMPVVWGEGEEERWRRIRAGIAENPLYRAIRGKAVVGTEAPLFWFKAGWAEEDRADLIVRVPRTAGPAAEGRGGDEYWIIDYKTGERNPAEEEKEIRKVQDYMYIVSNAWGVPARGFIWYLEQDKVLEVT